MQETDKKPDPGGSGAKTNPLKCVGKRLVKKLRRRFRNLGISKKILVWLLALIILPILIIVIIACSLSTTVVRNQTGELIEANLELSASNVQNFFETYDTIIQQIYTDTEYIDNLGPINLWDNNRYYQAKHAIDGKLQDIVFINKNLLGIAIVGKNGDVCFYDSISNSNSESFCFDIQNITSSAPVGEAFSQKDTIYTKSYHKMRSEYGDKDYFYIVHQLTDFNNYQKGPIGCVILCVDESALKQVYNYEDTQYSVTFIVDAQGNIISYPDRKWIGENIFGTAAANPGTEALKEASLSFIGKAKYSEGKNLEVHLKGIQGGKLYVVNVQNISYALKDLRFISIILVLIGLLVAVFCILVSVDFSENTDHSVKQILTGMDAANTGDKNVRIPAEGNDEFAIISRHFNRMMDEIEKTQKQEKEALIREKDAEIRSLEAQINPHFLYNTLDAINWVAIDHKEYTVSRMLTSLATILRYSIHLSNEVVTIRDELEYLKKYVYLQQQRFQYSFLCTIESDEELLDCKIHKLLIQPLLENALVHAFPGLTGMDEVNIRVRKEDEDKIHITVKDNGKGMDSSLVELFNHFDCRQERSEPNIGIRNVITRVKLYYGEAGSLSVKSDEHGTCIVLLIPYER